MRSSINEMRNWVGHEVTVKVNGSSASGVLCSSGNHGVVLDINGSKRTFSGFVAIHPSS